jgi:GNAT superfamily N-acetyltransferase
VSVQRYLRIVAAQGRETEHVGPFRLHVNPAADSEGSNYAIPEDGAEPTDHEVATLIKRFGERARRPRLEFLPSTAPAAESALLRGGFAEQLRTTVMVCGPGEERTPPTGPGLTLEELGPGADDADLRALLQLQADAFGDVLSPARIDMARRWLGRWTTVLARMDGEPAGAGMSLDVHDATTELVGIATAERFRRRGVAAAVTAELTRRVRERGADRVFLTPGDPDAGRVYQRAGFRDADVMVHLRV